MFDSIFHINTDTVPFYISKGVVPIDTFRTSFVPFDNIPTTEQKFFFDASANVDNAIAEHFAGSFAGLPIGISSSIQNTLFIAFACCFILLSVLTRKDGSLFATNYKGLNSFASKSRSAFKEQITISTVWINLFLVFQTILVSSIIITMILWQKGGEMSLSNDNIYKLIGYVFGGVLFFVLFKYLLYRLINYTFPDWKLDEWISQYFIVIGAIGLAIFFPALFLTFTPEYFSVSLWSLIAVVAVILFFYYKNLLIIFVKNNIGLLNYFLYLCAIEIVPLVMIYKGGIILANIVGK